MIKTFSTPLAIALMVSAALLGCAGSEGTGTESQPMSSPSATGANTEASSDSSAMETDYSQLFAGVDNTARFDLATLSKMDPNLSTFAALLDQAELSETLMQQENPLTVFAPTNEAFAEWPQDSLNMLMKAEHKARLIKLLQAHLLNSWVSSENLGSSQRLETSGGEYVMVEAANDSSALTIGGATIVKADVAASNGVLHVVDKVLTPVAGTLDAN